MLNVSILVQEAVTIAIFFNHAMYVEFLYNSLI